MDHCIPDARQMKRNAHKHLMKKKCGDCQSWSHLGRRGLLYLYIILENKAG